MAFRPKFTAALLDKGSVTVSGTSSDTADVLDIAVSLQQGGRVARRSVVKIDGAWDVRFENEGFVAGPVVAVGVESRREHLTTTTWTQTLAIE
jgi:hypothetical protein